MIRNTSICMYNGTCSWSYRWLLAVFVLLLVTLSFLQNSYDIINKNNRPKPVILKINDLENYNLYNSENTISTNHASIEKTFERRKLIYQRSCSLIRKLITLNKKGLTNSSDLMSIFNHMLVTDEYICID